MHKQKVFSHSEQKINFYAEKHFSVSSQHRNCTKITENNCNYNLLLKIILFVYLDVLKQSKSLPSNILQCEQLFLHHYLVCLRSFLERKGPMSIESPSCMSDSLLAMAMAAYLRKQTM